MPSATILRTPNEDFWRLQVNADGGDVRWQHTPYLAFHKDTGSVALYSYLDELLRNETDDGTVVVKAWEGRWNSDHFVFTIKELKEHINAKL
jgi:hypothetical protein